MIRIKPQVPENAQQTIEFKERQPIAALRRDPRNARRHVTRQINQIVKSIQEFGFTNPILADETGTVIAGHGRLEAAIVLGMETVPTITIRGLSETQKAALRVADNKIAENATWDVEALVQELQLIGFDYAAVVAGFETAEIDLLIGTEGDRDTAADQLPTIDPLAPCVSRRGDLWLLAAHRLLCGDATDTAAVSRLLAGEKAQQVFTDPPYNVAIDGNVSGRGVAKHREFVMASGEMSEGEFDKFLETWLRHCAAFSADGAILHAWIDWRHVCELIGAAKAARLELKNICVWNKTNAGLGSLYRSKHEFVVVLKNGDAAHVNNIELGKNGRNRTNVWDYAGVTVPGEQRQAASRIHPTVKPVAMVADAIRDCSRRNGIILDCFAGSGTILIAAEITGQRAYAMEIDPTYVDATIRRWQEYTGDTAVHAETGQTFAAVAQERGMNGGEAVPAGEASEAEHGDE